jgi:hypothetical protein
MILKTVASTADQNPTVFVDGEIRLTILHLLQRILILKLCLSLRLFCRDPEHAAILKDFIRRNTLALFRPTLAVFA